MFWQAVQVKVDQVIGPVELTLRINEGVDELKEVKLRNIYRNLTPIVENNFPS